MVVAELCLMFDDMFATRFRCAMLVHSHMHGICCFSNILDTARIAGEKVNDVLRVASEILI